MCVCITCKGGARPSEEVLESAARTNRDGAGVAWVEEVDGEPMVKWEKGLEVDGAAKLVDSVPHPFIVHFRAQSTGDATDNLTHPFPISPQADDATSGEAKRVLFHNGTVTGWEDTYRSFIASRPTISVPPYGLDRMSDTRALAYMVYHQTRLEEGEHQKLKAENLLQVFGGKSRFAILDAEDAADPNSDQGIRILGNWWYSIKVDEEEDAEVPYTKDGVHYEGGLLFSNKNWRSRAITQ